MGQAWAKIAAGSVGSPWINSTWGCWARVLARGESGLRVRARMRKLWLWDWASRASTTAPPCLPVAPTTRILWRAIVSRYDCWNLEVKVEVLKFSLLILGYTFLSTKVELSTFYILLRILSLCWKLKRL